MRKNGPAIVRPETSADHEQIRALVTVAMRSNEAELVELIRESENYIPDLALVAEQVRGSSGTYDIPEGVFMVKLLSGYEERFKGQIVCPAAFDVTYPIRAKVAGRHHASA